MSHFICQTCGTQFPLTEAPPPGCPICLDERQYVGPRGQQWTTLDELRTSHHNVIKTEEPGLTGIGTEPGFAIGQRAQLIQTPSGNILWECITLIDDETVRAVNALGGISAIAISHPHYYACMVEWSHAFGRVPIYIHADDARWVMRPDPAIVFWRGETHALAGGTTLIRCGGHFAGSQVLHWPQGAGGRGALLTGDTLYVVSDRRYVSFMYSYPNHIPLPESAVRRIVQAVEPYPYDRVYSAWFERVIPAGAKDAVARSAQRYLQALRGEFPLPPPPG